MSYFIKDIPKGYKNLHLNEYQGKTFKSLEKFKYYSTDGIDNSVIKAIKKYNGIDSDTMVYLTAGCDPAIFLLLLQLKPTTVYIPSGNTYQNYQNFCKLLDIPVKHYQINEPFELKHTELMINCIPVNSSGKVNTFIPTQGTILFDLVYFDYYQLTHGNEILNSILKIPNSYICKSFSKAFGLADLRIGYILTKNKHIITEPKTVSRQSKLAVLKILNNLQRYKENAVETIKLNTKYSSHFPFCNFMTFGYHLQEFEANKIAIKQLNPGMRVTTNKCVEKIFDNSLQKVLYDYNIQSWCINLYHRKDRYNHSKEQFKKMGLHVNYFKTEKTKDGTLGCWNSHFELIRKLANSTFDYFLIFEDDIYFEKPNLKNLRDNLKTNPSLLFLGATIFKYIEKQKHYNKAYFMGAHAYIISKQEAVNLMTFNYNKFYKQTGLGIDDYFTLYCNPKILKFPFCFQKTINESDTIWNKKDNSLQRFYSKNNILKQKIGNLFGNEFSFIKYKKMLKEINIVI